MLLYMYRRLFSVVITGALFLSIRRELLSQCANSILFFLIIYTQAARLFRGYSSVVSKVNQFFLFCLSLTPGKEETLSKPEALNPDW